MLDSNNSDTPCEKVVSLCVMGEVGRHAARGGRWGGYGLGGPVGPILARGLCLGQQGWAVVALGVFLRALCRKHCTVPHARPCFHPRMPRMRRCLSACELRAMRHPTARLRLARHAWLAPKV